MLLCFSFQGGSAANTDGPTDDEDSDGRSHYSLHGNNNAGTGAGSNFSQTYRERRREAHTQVTLEFGYSKKMRKSLTNLNHAFLPSG